VITGTELTIHSRTWLALKSTTIAFTSKTAAPMARLSGPT